jgi:opacity protein-like surface antigen
MKQLLLLLTVFPLTVFCQTSDSLPKRKFAIGLSFSPDYCFRTVKNPNSFNYLPEIPSFGFTTGMNLIYNPNRRIGLETGLLFFDNTQKTKQYDINFFPYNPSDPTKNTFIWHNLFLGIPIKIHYRILTQKIKLYLSAGISTNLLFVEKTSAVLEYSDGHTEISNSTNAGLIHVGFAAIGGLGISYDLSDKFAIKIEPTYRRFITSSFVEQSWGTHHSTGLDIGLYYKL